MEVMVQTSTRAVLCVGQATLDHIFRIESLAAGHKHVATSHQSVGGGVAANAAVAVSRLGGRALFVSRIGADAAGDQVVLELADEGVDVSHLHRRAGDTTPTSCVLVEASGERTIVNRTSADLFDDDVPDLDGIRPDAVLVDGRWPAGARRALRRARALGAPGVVDVDRAPTRADVADLGLATHLVFSADALAEFSATDDAAIGLSRAAASIDAAVAVTLGGQGVGWLDSAGAFSTMPAFDVEVVDSTGAGDVFHGAFALGLAERMEVPEAFRFANAAAALKCSRPGGRLGAPDRRAVDDFLGAVAES